MNNFLKASFLALAIFAVVVQMKPTMDRPNPARWVPRNLQDSTDEVVVAVNQTLLATVANANLTLVSVESFASRQFMIGNEFRAIYNASSTVDSTLYNCTTRIFSTWYIPMRPVHTGTLSHECHAM